MKKQENKITLSALNAIGVTESIKANGAKSIFKPEFSNKAERTKCRTKLINGISLYLLHIAKDKQELADKELVNIRAIANQYYLANDSFTNVEDYATNNMDENKKSIIKMFIENVPQKEVKEKKQRAPRKKAPKVEPQPSNELINKDQLQEA